MNAPPVWTDRELERELGIAIENFRKSRLEEPLDDYVELFDEYQGYVEELLEATIDLSEWDESALDILVSPTLFEALRYIAAPPISEDDLKIVAEVSSLSKKRLESNPDEVRKVLGVVREVFDRRRFCWLVEKRLPTEAEKSAAVMASAALLAVSRAQTNRRTLSKKLQEAKVKKSLVTLGLIEVKARPIKVFVDAPKVGEFCGECTIGGRKADIVIHLWDDRILPLECKVSNSSLNSVKRLNNDAAVKATVWRGVFGEQVVPAAVLSGVYSLASLKNAQERGLKLIWAHDLGPLVRWIQTTRPLKLGKSKS